MAALLVAMSIMAVMLTVAMPVWKQMTQREREEELVFRGMQYAHAIGMFQRKFANAYPPNIPAQEVQGSRHERRFRSDHRGPEHRNRRGHCRRVGDAGSDADCRRRHQRRTRRHDGSATTQPHDGTATGRSRHRSGGQRTWRSERRHHGRDEQKQRQIHSCLQRAQPLQRVAVRLRRAGGGAGRRRGAGLAGSRTARRCPRSTRPGRFRRRSRHDAGPRHWTRWIRYRTSGRIWPAATTDRIATRTVWTLGREITCDGRGSRRGNHKQNEADCSAVQKHLAHAKQR